MAKEKKEKATSVTDDIFSKLIDAGNSVTPGSTKLGSQMDSEITTWINTGSLLLNMILSNKEDGGWPCGRVIQMFGQQSIGKSTLSYVAIREAQAMGGISIYGDIEHAASEKFMKMLGVDMDRVIWFDTPDLEDCFEQIERYLKIIIDSGRPKNGKPSIIILDSIDALMPKSEVEGGFEFNMNVSMMKAKQLHKMLRKINIFLNKANCCLFAISQIKDNTTGYGPNFQISGGNALPFWASIRVYLKGKEKIIARDANAENEYQEALARYKVEKKSNPKLEKPERSKASDVTIGYTVTAYTIKNKTAPPDRTAHFDIIFTEGLKDENCYFQYLLDYGAIKKDGTARYKIVAWENDHGSFFKTAWLTDVLSDYDTYERVKKYLVDKLTYKVRDNSGMSISSEPLKDEEKEILEELKAEYSKQEQLPEEYEQD